MLVASSCQCRIAGDSEGPFGGPRFDSLGPLRRVVTCGIVRPCDVKGQPGHGSLELISKKGSISIDKRAARVVPVSLAGAGGQRGDIPSQREVPNDDLMIDTRAI